MEIQFKGVESKSVLTGAPFAAGDLVTSFLFQNEAGIIERVDLLKDEVDTFDFEGVIICRWDHRIRPKKESDSEAKKEALQSAEGLFLSLYDESEDDSDLSDENAYTKRLMKFFLSLHLERKRVLRAAGAGQVRHIKLKKEFSVPHIDITEEALVVLQGQLENLAVL